MTHHRCLSHYETLCVDRTASPERVRIAYRRLAQKFHPDKHAARRAAATDVMVVINQAYEVLSDPAQRAGYDEWLAAQEERAAAGGAGAAAVFVPDRFGWSGWLLWAIASVAVLTIGFVAIRTYPPLQVAPATAPAAAREPARTAAPSQPAAGPMARLVREAVPQRPPNHPTGNP